jgi:predicted ester cyclase
MARQFVEEIIVGDGLDKLKDYLTDDYVDHSLPPGVPAGAEGLKQLIGMFKGASPDLKVTYEDMIAEGDKVVMRVTNTGTHKGEMMGIPASGKSVNFSEIHIMRVAGGKFAEHWGLEDNMALMQQIGAMPEMGG